MTHYLNAPMILQGDGYSSHMSCVILYSYDCNISYFVRSNSVVIHYYSVLESTFFS